MERQERRGHENWRCGVCHLTIHNSTKDGDKLHKNIRECPKCVETRADRLRYETFKQKKAQVQEFAGVRIHAGNDIHAAGSNPIENDLVESMSKEIAEEIDDSAMAGLEATTIIVDEASPEPVDPEKVKAWTKEMIDKIPPWERRGAVMGVDIGSGDDKTVIVAGHTHPDGTFMVTDTKEIDPKVSPEWNAVRLKLSGKVSRACETCGKTMMLPSESETTECSRCSDGG